MLFLYRPPQTWMPYSLPKNRTAQAQYNRQMQDKYAATRRVPAAAPAEQRDLVADLKELGRLRDSGMLTEAEFETAKSKLLAGEDTA